MQEEGGIKIVSAIMSARELYWDHIEDKTILAVEAELANPDVPGGASFWHINFYVEGYRLLLSANADSDEIIIGVEPAVIVPPTDPAMLAVLRGLVGRAFGWNWNAVNSQGYADMLILAFDGAVGAGITPHLAFLVEGSMIHIHRIAPLEA